MAKKPTNIIGQRYGKLLVIGTAGKGSDGRVQWDCLCECGKHVFVKYHDLKTGKVKSCGCLKAERVGNLNKIHGDSKSRLWFVWVAMRERCYNKNYNNYKNYGERGIKVCEEWNNNFYSFREWAYMNGYDENAEYMKCTLDRIDVNGDYCPENCRWVSLIEQSRNKRNNHYVEINGETKILTDWIKEYKINSSTVWYRVKHGWDIIDALTIPPRSKVVFNDNKEDS